MSTRLDMESFKLGMSEFWDDVTLDPYSLESYDAGRAFFSGYVACALWSSTDDSDDNGGNTLDANYGPNDIAPDTLESMRAECADFVAAAGATLLLLATARPGYTWERAGHDFWLTRNGHGAGYWDRDELEAGDLGDALSVHARSCGEVYLYVGDDGRIYQ